MIVTTSFLGCTFFAVTSLCGSFSMYLMHKIYDLSNRFFHLLFCPCVLLPVILPVFSFCYLTFFFWPLQLVILVVPCFPKILVLFPVSCDWFFKSYSNCCLVHWPRLLVHAIILVFPFLWPGVLTIFNIISVPCPLTWALKTFNISNAPCPLTRALKTFNISNAPCPLTFALKTFNISLFAICLTSDRVVWTI